MVNPWRGSYKNGNIPLLGATDTISIKSGFVFGFGPAEITTIIAGVTKKAIVLYLDHL